MIKHKFGENVSTDSYGVGAWKSIRSLRPKLERNLHMIIGDGKSKRLWKDAWKEHIPLMETFPDPFILSNN